ncbi:hypothetical protein HK102_012370 [Quaeritorhiza haematococci]|nr:hypothetical protein HK102_012370 [Quaeritorhiza haematococci]
MVYRLNDAKVHNWCKKRVSLIFSKYDEYSLFKPVMFQESSHRLIIVLKIVSDCLSTKWKDELYRIHGVEDKGRDLVGNAKPHVPMVAPSKPKPTSSSTADAAAAKKRKVAGMSNGQKALAKASTKGMKSITSFFAKN